MCSVFLGSVSVRIMHVCMYGKLFVVWGVNILSLCSTDKIVTPEWIMDSIREARLLPIEPYLLYTTHHSKFITHFVSNSSNNSIHITNLQAHYQNRINTNNNTNNSTDNNNSVGTRIQGNFHEQLHAQEEEEEDAEYYNDYEYDYDDDGHTEVSHFADHDSEQQQQQLQQQGVTTLPTAATTATVPTTTTAVQGTTAGTTGTIATTHLQPPTSIPYNNSTHEDFVSQFFKKSRLHYLSTWRNEFQHEITQYLMRVAKAKEKSDTASTPTPPFPGKILDNSLKKSNHALKDSDMQMGEMEDDGDEHVFVGKRSSGDVDGDDEDDGEYAGYNNNNNGARSLGIPGSVVDNVTNGDNGRLIIHIDMVCICFYYYYDLLS